MVSGVSWDPYRNKDERGLRLILVALICRCVIAQMTTHTKRPILEGRSEREQLRLIWKLCGSPTEENLPGWDKWGGCQGSYELPQYPLDRRVGDEFGKYVPLLDCVVTDVPSLTRFHDLTSSCGVILTHLIGRLLTLDRHKRFTAEQAFDHEYFFKMPRPLDRNR